MSIDINARIHIDPFEVEAHLLVSIVLAKCQHPTIPALACRQIGSLAARDGITVETLVDAPIMGQRDSLRLGEVTVVQYELPLVVEQLLTLDVSSLD